MDISKDQLKSAFAFNLNKHIRNNGLTHSEFAKIVDISKTAMSHYITGRNLPRYEHIIKIANALGCTPNDLMNISDETLRKAEIRRKCRLLN